VKPAPFDYYDPHSLGEAVALFATYGDDAKALAGGQSLVPLLNFRLARPAVLVDLNRVAELSYLRKRGGRLEIGAMCRQSRLEIAPVAQEGWPLLANALEFVAHPQIRHRGTVGGSAAHGDPAAELPVALACLDATFIARSARGGERRLTAGEFFVTHLTTALDDDELLVEIQVPALPPGSRYAFCEHAVRQGDFAIGGAAVRFRVDDEGRCWDTAIALLGAADVPLRAREAEMALTGQPLNEDMAREVAAIAIRDVEPSGDRQGSTDYRRRIVEIMIQRALVLAQSAGVRGA
jgi:CO/xanthine dehydrogenase FAD-binding subunit